jgi:hypothetical protein
MLAGVCYRTAKTLNPAATVVERASLQALLNPARVLLSDQSAGDPVARVAGRIGL